MPSAVLTRVVRPDEPLSAKVNGAETENDRVEKLVLMPDSLARRFVLEEP